MVDGKKVRINDYKNMVKTKDSKGQSQWGDDVGAALISGEGNVLKFDNKTGSNRAKIKEFQSDDRLSIITFCSEFTV